MCTRDRCLTGDGDTVKFNWHEAVLTCETRSWRLCSKKELNKKASSGCCSSRASPTNLCGYDSELVWTINTGDFAAQSIVGQLHSKAVLENVTRLTIDLLRVHNLDGIKIQGGIPGPISNGRACLL